MRKITRASLSSVVAVVASSIGNFFHRFTETKTKLPAIITGENDNPARNPIGKHGGGGGQKTRRNRRYKHHRAWKKVFGGIACPPYIG